MWYTAWCRWKVCQVEFSELMVVFSHGTFTLENNDLYASLVVRGGAEHLTFLGWDDSSAGDD